MTVKNDQQACISPKFNNNQKLEKYLCGQCAQDSGEMNSVSDVEFSGIQDLLKGMLGQGFANIPQVKNRGSLSRCGMTYTDFSRTGKVGCSACFIAYGDQLEPVLRRIHGSCSHKGKVPKRSGGKLALRQNLQSAAGT